MLKDLKSRDLVAIVAIIVLGVLIALGHDSILTTVFICILSAYGIIKIPIEKIRRK